ncbi:MAG: type I glutamate--ammonia ligase [Fusicatenibacter sp.]|nr:type I glutamate--ammonia ligase [Lachnospiraceae bacterium]MDY2939241.1 type I glutamate--ammonia ligase [Fusicatenibacter sp.]
MAKFTKEAILQMADEEDVEFIRLQFTDMFGTMKNMAITSSQLEKALDNKCVFDGSSFEGFVTIEEADMFLHPDPDTFAILPWRPQQGKVARLICDVYDRDGHLYQKSSRSILQNVIQEAADLGFEFHVAPECEFFLFHTDEDGGATAVTHDKAGYLDLGPLDLGENARRDMVLTLEELGFEVQSSFHEVAAGQHELDFCSAPALLTADQLMTAKFAIKTIAKRHGLHATFMPKPKAGVHGSGMHLSFSLFRDGKDVFRDEKDEYGLSQEAYYFIGGIMKHVRGMAAITNPLINSYKRLVPGYGAPIYIAWSAINRSPLIRIPMTGDGITAIELRCPDPSCNPYLALAVCLAAGMDGIRNQIQPPSPVNRNISGMTEEERAEHHISILPENLEEAIAELEKDDFLRGVLGEEFVSGYIDAKKKEWQEYIQQVSNWEIEKYLYRI